MKEKLKNPFWQGFWDVIPPDIFAGNNAKITKIPLASENHLNRAVEHMLAAKNQEEYIAIRDAELCEIERLHQSERDAVIALHRARAAGMYTGFAWIMSLMVIVLFGVLGNQPIAEWAGATGIVTTCLVGVSKRLTSH
jgi:hypothetical protein